MRRPLPHRRRRPRAADRRVLSGVHFIRTVGRAFGAITSMRGLDPRIQVGPAAENCDRCPLGARIESGRDANNLGRPCNRLKSDISISLCLTPRRPAVRRRSSFDALLASLQAAGEVTRLRLIGLLSEAELTVSELVAILGQSQPRVSRHLKLLVEAGLAERQREGAWAFFRLADPGGALARALIARVDPADPTFAADRARLAAAREARRKQAAAYFAERAADWDAIRALHAPESRVEAAILAMVGDKPIRGLLDLGTGTGRMLELLAPRADRAVGVDQSPAMLAVARARIDAERPAQRPAAPGRHLCAAGRARRLRPRRHPPGAAFPRRSGARAGAKRRGRCGRRAGCWWSISPPMARNSCARHYAHRRLGFADEEIAGFLADAGLAPVAAERVAPAAGEPDKLTVALWLARDRRIIADPLPKPAMEFA